MSTAQGKFVWCELMTTDTASAEKFYKQVIGWQAKDSGIPDRQYTMFAAGEKLVAGLLELPAAARQQGARAGWIGYVAVDDVDAVADRIKAAGGRVHHAPEDIPNVGRFAVVADPQSATLGLFKPSMPGEGPPAAGFIPGHVGWHELHAADGAAAFEFYAGLFGWTKGEAMDMGTLGVYQIFAVGGAQTGGMMTKTDAVAVPFWLYYFNVGQLDPAMARTREAGGLILHEPQQVPGGAWIVHCRDPEGAMFAMVAPQR